MNINQVKFKDGKWYCKNCGKLMKKSEFEAKYRSKYYKKGDKIIIFSHINKIDSKVCSAKNNKGKHLSQECKNKLSLINKGKKLSQETKNKIINTKSNKYYKLKTIENRSKKNFKLFNEVVAKIDPNQYPEVKLCNKCDKKLYRHIDIAYVTTKKYKKGAIKNIYYDHNDITLNKKCFLTNSSKEEYKIYELLKSIDKNILWSPKKDIIKSYIPKIINYPGRPDFINLSFNHIIEYQGLGGHHFNKVFDPDNEHDLKLLDEFKNSNSKFKNIIAYVWGYHDPIKRQWCKDNNITLIEFWSISDVYKYLKQYYNISFLPTVI